MSALTTGAVFLALLFTVVGCSSAARETTSDGGWVGSITTEGQVTTVMNEAGSVWGGMAELVEEASIGVDFGDERYMLGRVSSLTATDDEIFVVDGQVNLVRVYDMQGRHRRDLGAEGQGPGEYTRPRFVATIGDRVLVQDAGASRINVYGPGPGEVDSWPMGVGQCCIHPMMVVADGTLWIEGRIVNEETRQFEDAAQPHGPDGPIGEPFPVPPFSYERWTYFSSGRQREGIPQAPGVVWNMHPAGALVAGANDRYRFEIRSSSGARTVVERFWEPVPLTPQEVEFWTRNMQERLARFEQAGNPAEWDGRLPPTKPAYGSLLTAVTGEIWVVREEPAEIIGDCETGDSSDLSLAMVSPEGVRPPGACFITKYAVDVFDVEGRYLGPVDWGLPHPYSFIRGDMVIAPAEDRNGTVMVKRYRLVLPGDS